MMVLLISVADLLVLVICCPNGMIEMYMRRVRYYYLISSFSIKFNYKIIYFKIYKIHSSSISSHGLNIHFFSFFFYSVSSLLDSSADSDSGSKIHSSLYLYTIRIKFINIKNRIIFVYTYLI